MPSRYRSSTAVRPSRRLPLLRHRVIIESTRRARKLPQGDEGAVSANRQSFVVAPSTTRGYTSSKGVLEKVF